MTNWKMLARIMATLGAMSLPATGAFAGNPSNDDCITAEALPSSYSGVIGGTLHLAFPGPGPSCVTDSRPDVFYQYTAPCDGLLRLNTCGTNDAPGTDTGLDTVLSIHPDACPLQASLACNDDWPSGAGTCVGSDGGLFRDSFIALNVSLGDTFIIRVGSFSSTLPAFRDFFLRWTLEPTVTHPNETCGSPFVLPLNTTFVVDLSCARTEPAMPGDCVITHSLWYIAVPPADGVLEVTTCGTFALSGYDTVIASRQSSSAPCTSGTYETQCIDDASGRCGDQGSFVDSFVSVTTEFEGTPRIGIGLLAQGEVAPGALVTVTTKFTPFGAGGCDLPGDENDSGVVDFDDLNRVLGNFGNECP